MQNSESASTTTTDKMVEKLEALSVGEPAKSSSSLGALRIQSALDYIDAVKGRFLEDQPQVNSEFLNILGDFHHQRTDTAGVIKRIELLFEGHPDLIKRFFDEFVPPDHTVSGSAPAQPQKTKGKDGKDNDGSGTASPEDEWRSKTPTPKAVQPANTTEKAMPGPTVTYIQKVKQECDVDTWQQFITILRRRREDPSTFSEEEMIKDVEELFEDHPDLRPGFRTFLASGGQ